MRKSASSIRSEDVHAFLNDENLFLLEQLFEFLLELAEKAASAANILRHSPIDHDFILKRNEAFFSTLDVIRHTLDWLSRGEGYRPDAVMLLQPTSPLRRAAHIDAAVELLIANDADSAVSVVEVPHQFNPISVLKIEGGRLAPFSRGPLITRRQDKPVVYARNGPALVLTRRSILEQGQLYGAHNCPLLMAAEESVDIDERRDLEYVEFLLSRRNRPVRLAG